MVYVRSSRSGLIVPEHVAAGRSLVHGRPDDRRHLGQCRLTFSLLVPDADKTPEWFSDFSSATGAGSTAMLDTDKWDDYTTDAASIVTAASTGLSWPSGLANVMRCTFNPIDDGWSNLDGRWTAPTEGNYLYRRWYACMTLTGTTGHGGNSHHPIEGRSLAYPGCNDGSSGWSHKIGTGSGEWDYIKLHLGGVDYCLGTAFTDQGYSGDNLTKSHVYRFEERWHRQAGSGFKYVPRIYNQSNVLVFDASDFLAILSPYDTLANNDPTFTVSDTCIAALQMGTNGPALWSTDVGYMYYGGVGVYKSSSPTDWIGAYGSLIGENA